MDKIICNINMDGDILWTYCAKYKSFNHNNYGPAVIRSNGSKFWIVRGLFHRLNGPAVEYADGDKSWYINDDYYNSEFEYWLAVHTIMPLSYLQ